METRLSTWGVGKSGSLGATSLLLSASPDSKVPRLFAPPVTGSDATDNPSLRGRRHWYTFLLGNPCYRVLYSIRINTEPFPSAVSLDPAVSITFDHSRPRFSLLSLHDGVV